MVGVIGFEPPAAASRMKQTKGLTPEQQTLFDSLTRLQQGTCIGVLAGMSGTESHKRVGGKAKTSRSAESASSTMLRNVVVKAFLDSVRDHRLIDTIMTRDEALRKLTELGRITVPDMVGDNKEIVRIKIGVVIESIKQIRAMQGWDAAEKHVLTNKAGEDVLPDAHELVRRMLFLINMGVVVTDRTKRASITHDPQ